MMKYQHCHHFPGNLNITSMHQRVKKCFSHISGDPGMNVLMNKVECKV